MNAHPLTRSLLRGACLLLPAALLSACGGHKEVAKAAPPVTDKIVEIHASERDALGAYRFNMSEGDKRMSADEFEAWMKSNGIRVAKGNPNATPAAKPVVVATKQDPKDKKKKK
ncbi:MAG: hypothetical protein ACREPD_11775 [Stenotrophomonas sp.]|uniref:hypothetical protein n=1 Tax=Stenotrophomonas sp. TaxID=69392 RepID=UPI003D6CDC30